MPSDAKLPLLIAEDDPHIRHLLEAAARRSGIYEPVTVAADGAAALETLQHCDADRLPSLLVTDLSMPRMTGIELLQAVKKDSRLGAIPVAVITSSDIPNDRELALAAGACAFLRKPQGLEALTKALTELRAYAEAAAPSVPAR